MLGRLMIEEVEMMWKEAAGAYFKGLTWYLVEAVCYKPEDRGFESR
jgi:hypothetical protein